MLLTSPPLRREHRLKKLLMVVASCALVGACSVPGTGSSTSAHDTSASAGTPGSAGSRALSLLTASLPETLNPIAGFANTGKGKINESLFTLKGSADSLPDIVPHLALADPKISPDGLTWTLTLKPDLTFSDGSALTARDVAATYTAVADPRSASPIAGDLAAMKSVVAQGKDTVVFTLKHPQVSFKTALLIGIAPAAKITPGQKVEDSPLNTKPVGSGPYVVDRFSSDRLVLAANRSYRSGAPEVERLTYALAADDNTRAQRMKAGEFDGSVLTPRLVQPFRSSPTMEVITATSADWRGLSLPPGNPVTADKAIRKALNVGVDRRAIVDGVLLGQGRPADTFIPPQYGDFYNPQASFGYDHAAAQSLLEDAGWRAGRDGIRVKDGQRAAFTLMYKPTDLVRRDLAAAFASDALKLGIDVTIEGVEFSAAESRIDRDALMLGGGDTPYDVDTQIYKNLHSSYPAAGAYYDNPGRFADPAMDSLLDTARTSTDPATRVKAYQEVQKRYVDTPSMVILAFVDHVYLQKKSIAAQWNVTSTLLEPHEHGTAWGPWVDVDAWTRKG